MQQSSAVEEAGEAIAIRELLCLSLALLEQRNLAHEMGVDRAQRFDFGVDVTDGRALRHRCCRHIARSGDGIAVIEWAGRVGQADLLAPGRIIVATPITRHRIG